MGKKKLQIAICDDMEPVCKELVREINSVLEQEQIVGEVEYFTSGHKLLERIGRYDIVFLDMDMPGMDGIDVGIEIENRNPKCKIIIASSREDRFKETYRIHPLRFISKPFDEDEIREAIQAFQEQQMGYTEIEVFKDRKTYKFCQRDVQYISSYKGGVEMLVKGELYRNDETLNQIELMLEKEMFVRVHKSYIVNLFFVTEVQEHKIKVGNIVIPISRRQKKEFEEAYMNFDVKYR